MHHALILTNEITNGMPSKRRLKDGDILKLQVGIIKDKFFSIIRLAYSKYRYH